MGKKRVLFICRHNSARSQIAEALLKKLYGDKYEAYSAGITPAEINPYVVRAMAEVGIDISKQRPKSLMEFWGQKFDYVVTVCTMQRKTARSFQAKK